MAKDCACSHAKCNKTPKGKMCAKHGMDDCSINEGNLRNWFKGSSSTDGKSGWVNVVTGGTCASDEPGEGTPKCVSSSKRASMTKAERLSASNRKKLADPGQQAKSGAAKPTYVSTDKEKKMNEESDKKGKGSGTKDACYTKVKSRYDVWPSAYASGALVKCRKAGAANWGNKTEAVNPAQQAAIAIAMKKAGKKPKSEMKEQTITNKILDEILNEKCWTGYKKKGMKTMFGKKYPNCVKIKSPTMANENHVAIAAGKEKDEEGYMSRVEFDQIERSINILRKIVKKSDQQIPAWVQSKITRAADFIDTAADYMSSDEEVSEACWVGYTAKGMKKKGGKLVPNCVKSVVEQMLPPIDSQKHRDAQRTQKLYNKGTSTDNPNEKDTFLKRTGPQLPLAGKGGSPGQPYDGPDKKGPYVPAPQRPKVQMAHYEPEGNQLGEGWPFGSDTVTPQNSPTGTKSVEVGKKYAARQNNQPVDVTYNKTGEKKVTPMPAARAGLMQYKYGSTWGTNLNQSYQPEGELIDEAPKTIYSVGQTYSVVLNWRTKVINIKFFFPTQQRPTKEEVQAAIDKIYPGGILYMYTPAINDPTKPFIFANENAEVIGETAAWQRKEGKNPEGGLNKAGIASYRRENPGSKLSMAVTTPPSKLDPDSKSAKRRKSFCARMGGVEGPMKDEKGRPTRKALALRKWNC